MSLGLKVFAAAATVGGCGIAIPIYLKSGGDKGQEIKVQSTGTKRPSQADTSRTSRGSQSIEKVSCNVSASSSASSEMTDFAKINQQNLGLYSFVSCTNSSVRGRGDSYLGNLWKGLFPTDLLNTRLSYNGGGKISIIATTEKEVNDMGNEIPWTTFSNPDTKDSIKGQWDLRESNFQKDQKKEIVLSIQGISKTPNKVYLFVDSTEQKEADQAQ